MNVNSYTKRASQVAFFLLRVVAGFLFMQAGSVILFGWFGGMPGGVKSPPPLLSLMWIGGVLEFFGGIAIMLGLATHPVAFILSGQMAVAYWKFHSSLATPWPVQNNGMAAVLLCFIFLYLAAQGGGEWSLDALIRRKRERATGAIRASTLKEAER